MKQTDSLSIATPILVGLAGLLVSAVIAISAVNSKEMPESRFSIIMNLSSMIAAASLAGVFGNSVPRQVVTREENKG
jgi:hypothetical protein